MGHPRKKKLQILPNPELPHISKAARSPLEKKGTELSQSCKVALRVQLEGR